MVSWLIPQASTFAGDVDSLILLIAVIVGAWFLAADVGLVDLHDAGQPVASGPDQHRTQPVQHRPRGLVAAETELALDLFLCRRINEAR